MTIRRALRAAAALSLLGAALAGCAANGTADDGRLSVAAGFYPLAWVAQEVGGPEVRVVNLTAAGQEPHDSELTVNKTVELARADLVLLSGGLQPTVDQAAQENAQGAVLDATDVVTLRRALTDGHHEDDGHNHDHEQDHEHGDLDPHFWLDPLLMADLADAVADELGGIDPERATTYAANADALRAELTGLDGEFAEGLARCERDTMVVSHDAFGYWERYGLHFEAIAGLSPGAEPTPADLQRLQELIQQQGLTTVFTETLVAPDLAQSLAEDLGIETAVLDPLEGLDEASIEAGADYLSVMRDNLAALQEAGGC